MKKIPISLLTLLLIIGCGFDKKDLNDIRLLDDSEKVSYSDEGKYDLSEYLFPNQDVTYIYQRVKYRDNQGDKNYNKEPLRVNNSERVEYKIVGDSVKEGSDINYTIKDVSVQKIELVDDFYDVREYRRFVDINDTYYSYEHVDTATTLYQVGWLTCKVEEQLNYKEILDRNYSDVLILMCKSESAEGVRGEFSEKKNFTSRLYFAKDIGEIGAIGEECSIKQYNSIYKSCTKTVKQLKDILK